MNAIEAIKRAAELPADDISIRLTRDDLAELVDTLNELEGPRWERNHAAEQRRIYPEFRPANGHWYVQDGQYTCVGEIADLDTARVRVTLEQASQEAGVSVSKRIDRGNWSPADLTSLVLDVIARRYAAEGAS